MRATVECNTHEELKNGGKGLAVSYSFASTPFGEVVMASAVKGIGYETRLHLVGTEFQRKVWVSLLKIPRGATATYGEIAAKIGNPYACRAVGSAVGHNPVSLIVPCHRVVPSSGDIGNYRWGRAIKKSILEWESTDD